MSCQREDEFDARTGELFSSASKESTYGFPVLPFKINIDSGAA